MGQTKLEKMIGVWIGNEASAMETELPEGIGLLDLSILLASRTLRAFAAGADRICFEVDPEVPALWECVNEMEPRTSYAEPPPEATICEVWDGQAEWHAEHRVVPDTVAWLEVRGDPARAKVGVRFGPADPVDALAEVVSASAYHLLLCGARRVLVELGRDFCLVMTPEAVSQEAVDRAFGQVEQPENIPLRELPRRLAG
ncbi:MAG: hypothetical protein ACM3RP_14000 [Chitinophagales bacterium]